MSVDKVLSLISSDDVETAYNTAKDLFLKVEKRETQAFKVLIGVNKLTSSATENNCACKSSPSSIFSLSDLCCTYIRETWKCTNLQFLRCIYHIKHYLLNQGCFTEAERLCKYYFELRSSRGERCWGSPEKVVITNTVYNIASYMCKTDKSSQIIFKDDISSYLDRWKFLLELVELNDYENLCMHFTVSANFISATQPLLSAAEHMGICNRILSKYIDWFDSLSIKGVTLNFNKKNFSSLMADLINTLLNSMSDEYIMKSKCSQTLRFLKSFCSVLGDVSDHFETVKLLIKLFVFLDNLNSDGLVESFVEFKSAFENYSNCKKSVLCEVVIFFYQVIYKFRSFFSKNDEFNNKVLLDLMKMVLDNQFYIEACKLPVNKKLSIQVYTLFALMYFTFSLKNSSKVLSDVSKEMRRVFKAFISISNITDVNSLFCFGVSGCINVLMSYNKAKLYSSSATLAVYFIKYLLKFDTNHLITLPMKNYIEHGVNSFIQSLGELGHEETAQIGLMALVGVHKELHEMVFTAWANLKVSKSNTSFNMESTVYDVIQNNKDILESEWPPCKVEAFQYDYLLLKEIRSYSKHKCLHMEPVLAVYRTAAQVCTNKLILAEILNCTMDVITVQPEPPNIYRFEISLANIIQHLNKRLVKSVDPVEKLYISCLLGNIHYQKARCEIMHLRKKSENEIIQIDAKPKENVPILEANEGDILNESFLPPESSCLTLEAQGSVMEMLEKALNYWKKSCETLDPTMVNEYFDLSLGYIKATGYLYRLYSYKVKEVETWELLYELGGKLGSHKHQVLAVAELLNVQFSVRSDWVESAHLFIQNEVVDKNSYVGQLFVISQAKNSFNNKKIKESQSILDKLDLAKVRSNWLVFYQHQILATLLSGAEKIQSSDHTQPISSSDCPIPAVKIFGNLLYLVSHSKWDTFCHLCVLHCILLDTSLFLGKLYCGLKYVRHARCYTRKQLDLAQRLALPIRVAELLILHAKLDILCANSADCNIKLKGVEKILELESYSDEMEYKNMLIDGVSSPACVNTVKLQPKFANHAQSCACFYCSNVDYHIQSLQAITLRADHLVTKGSSSEAKQLFKAGKNLIKVLNSKFKTTCANLITTIAEAEIRFYEAAVTALGRWNSLDKAMDYCQLAKRSLNEMRVPNITLHTNFDYYETCLKLIKNYSSPSVKNRRGVSPIRRQNVVFNAVTPTNVAPAAPKLTVRRNKLELPVSPMVAPSKRTLIFDNAINVKHKGPVKEPSIPIRNLKIPTILITPIGKSDSDHPNNLGDADLQGKKYLNKNLLKISQSERKPSRIETSKEPGTPLNTGVFYTGTSSVVKVYCDDADELELVNTARRGRSRRKQEPLNMNNNESASVLTSVSRRRRIGTRPVDNAPKLPARDHASSLFRKLTFDEADEVKEDGVIKLDDIGKDETKQKEEKEKESNSDNDNTSKDIFSVTQADQWSPEDIICDVQNAIPVRRNRSRRLVDPLKAYNHEPSEIPSKGTNLDDQSPKRSVADSEISIIENTPPEKAASTPVVKKLQMTPSHLLLKDFKALTISKKDKSSGSAVCSELPNPREVKSTRLRSGTVLKK